MRPLVAFLVIFYTIVIISGCGDAPSTDPTSTKAGVADPSASKSSVSMTVAGDLELTVQTGIAELGLDMTSDRNLALKIISEFTSASGSDDTVTLTLFMLRDIQPGEYPLESGGTADESQPVGLLVTHFRGGDLSMVIYDQDVNGTLTLTETGDRFSGSFTGSVSRGVIAGSLSVEGQFQSISDN